MQMPDALIKFGEWMPDISDLNTQASANIQNVVPRGDGYGPFQDFVTFTQTLPGPCRGYFFARNSDGSITIFAATATDLYELSNTDFSWGKVSKGGSSYSPIPNTGNWQFVQFNTLVIAVQINTVPQIFTLGSSSAFSDLGGSPPQCSFIAIINRFLVVGGISGFPYRVQWSGLNAPTTWDNVTAQSNFQDLADSGRVVGLAGGDQFGVIFQDQAIRSMIFAPGSAVVFDILKLANNDGLLAPLAAVNAGDNVFYVSPQGFKVIAPGGYPEPIGKEKVDRTFFADLDQSNLQLLIGATDPTTTRVYFAYKSNAGQAGLFDKIMVYDRVLNRWGRVAMSGQFLTSLSKPGLSLEALDAISPGIITVSGAANNGSGAVRLTLNSLTAGTVTSPTQASTPLVKNIGSNVVTSATSQNTVTLTTTKAIPKGATIVVAVCDEVGGSQGFSTGGAVSDGTNSYTQIVSGHLGGNPTAAIAALFSVTLGAALASGSTIIYTSPGTAANNDLEIVGLYVLGAQSGIDASVTASAFNSQVVKSISVASGLPSLANELLIGVALGFPIMNVNPSKGWSTSPLSTINAVASPNQRGITANWIGASGAETFAPIPPASSFGNWAAFVIGFKPVQVAVNIAAENTVTVYGVTGTTEANGTYEFTVVDPTHIDLIGPTFTNAYVSGGQIGGALDQLGFSLDSVSLAALVQLSMIGPANSAGFFTGPNLEGTMETPEEDGEGKRLFISQIRPMTDCPAAAVSIAVRDTAQATSVYTSETAVNDIGLCPIQGGGIDTRYARVKLRAPYGSVWTYAMGVEPDFRVTGSR